MLYFLKIKLLYVEADFFAKPMSLSDKNFLLKIKTNIFDELFSPFIGFMPFERVEDITCPVCKTTLKQFKTTGLLGCANCYDAFGKEISKIVGKIAPHTEHKQESIKPTKTKQTNEDKIAELKKELALAVKEERYEDAGKIKKQIQKLEAKDE